MNAFASMVEGMDKSLGDVLDKLDTLGVAEDTLVIFLGDNGTDAPPWPSEAEAEGNDKSIKYWRALLEEVTRLHKMRYEF